MGIARGVKEIFDLVRASSFTCFFNPLCLLNVPVSSANPDDAIINPPAIRSEFKLIPKKVRTYFPIKKEMSKIIRTLMEVIREILTICCLVLFSVKLKKIGTVPMGLITENREAKDSKNRVIFFSKITAQGNL